METQEDNLHYKLWYSEVAQAWHWVVNMDGEHHSGNAKTSEQAKKDMEITINWVKENKND